MTAQSTSTKSQTAHELFFLVNVALTFGFAFLCLFLANLASWHSKGFETLTKNLQQIHARKLSEIARKNQSFETFYESSIYQMDSKFQNALNESKEKINQIANSAVLPKPSKAAKKIEKSAWKFFPHLWQVFIETIEVALDKFAILATSTMFYLYALLYGIVDGLHERYIRTSETGRESTKTRSDWAKNLLKGALAILFFYLVLPPEIGITVITYTLAIFFFSYCFINCSRFKKYV